MFIQKIKLILIVRLYRSSSWRACNLNSISWNWKRSRAVILIMLLWHLRQ